MRRLLVADEDPHIGQAIRICFRRHGVRVSAGDGGPICPAPLRALIDASTNIQNETQHRVNPPRTITIRHRRPNRRASGDGAMSSGGAASVNQDRFPGVAGRRYTPQLE